MSASRSESPLFTTLERRKFLSGSVEAIMVLFATPYLPSPPRLFSESQESLVLEGQRLATFEGLNSSVMKMTEREFDDFMWKRAAYNLTVSAGLRNGSRFFTEYLPMRRQIGIDGSLLKSYNSLIDGLKRQFHFVDKESGCEVDFSAQFIVLAKLIEDFGVIDDKKIRVPVVENVLHKTAITVFIDLKGGGGAALFNGLTYSNRDFWKLVTNRHENKREDLFAHEFGHLLDQKRPYEEGDGAQEIWDSQLPLKEEEQVLYRWARMILEKFPFPFPNDGGPMYAYSPGEFPSSTMSVFVATNKEYFLNPDFKNRLGFYSECTFNSQQQEEIGEALKVIASIYSKFLYENKR